MILPSHYGDDYANDNEADSHKILWCNNLTKCPPRS